MKCRRADGCTDTGGYIIIPCHYHVVGYKDLIPVIYSEAVHHCNISVELKANNIFFFF